VSVHAFDGKEGLFILFNFVFESTLLARQIHQERTQMEAQ